MRSTGAKLAANSGRSINRDEVQYRTRGTGPGANSLALLIVNISEDGLMARCETPIEPGEILAVHLPVIGAIDAQVRWALGGRIGCQFAHGIPPVRYAEMLAALR